MILCTIRGEPGKVQELIDGLSRRSVDELVASWGWTGENPVSKCELVISYGAVRPWHCWVHRYHHVVPAEMDGRAATAEIPVFEPGCERLAYGNVTDGRGVVTSTIPIAVRPDRLGISRPTATDNINTALVADFSPVEMVFLQRHGTPVPGTPDTDEKHGGTQSLRVDDPKAVISMKLGHVPDHSHRLTLWLKAEKPTVIQVQVVGAPPANWGSPIVDMLRRQYAGTAAIKPADIKPPVFTLDAEADTQWRQFALDCPFDGMPVEGYNLVVKPATAGAAAYWVDTIRFEPQWQAE